MKFNVVIAGKTRVSIKLTRERERLHISVDGRPSNADAVELASNIFSILLNGQSHEIRVTPQPDGSLTLQSADHEFSAEVVDPRAWSGRRHGHVEAEGRQQIIAADARQGCASAGQSRG